MNHGSETDLGVVSNAMQVWYISKTYLPCMSEKVYLKWPLLCKIQSYTCSQKRRSIQVRTNVQTLYHMAKSWSKNKMPNQILYKHPGRLLTFKILVCFNWAVLLIHVKDMTKSLPGPIAVFLHFPLAVSWSTWHSGLQRKKTSMQKI